MKKKLDYRTIDQLFRRLHGIYGAAFTRNYATGELMDGKDTGIENAKNGWAIELADYQNRPDVFAYAIDKLPEDRPPNARQFRNLCRQAPLPCTKALPRKFTNEERQRNIRRVGELADIVAGRRKLTQEELDAIKPVAA